MNQERKKGTAEMLVLALLSERDRHGYELAKLIETRSEGALVFQVASLYPLLYRLEKKKLISGRWVEKAGERRRRFYRLSPKGDRALDAHRESWREFVEAVDRITGFGAVLGEEVG